jgi:hypothetical protein
MSRESTALHESGHYIVARALGARNVRAEVHGRDGGGAVFHGPIDPPVARAAVAVSGYVAEAMRDGVPGLATRDRAEAAHALEAFPAEQRASLLAEAEERARQILVSESELLDAVAWQLRTVGSFP